MRRAAFEEDEDAGFGGTPRRSRRAPGFTCEEIAQPKADWRKRANAKEFAACVSIRGQSHAFNSNPRF
jgi:hypothetical protein